MRFLVTFALVALSVALLIWGVQLGDYDNNICDLGPCLSPLRLGLGAGMGFAAWAAWFHLPAPVELKGALKLRPWLLKLLAVCGAVLLALVGSLLGIIAGQTVMGTPQANTWFVAGGILLGLFVGRWLWRRADALGE